MHRELTARGADLASKKEASNRVGGGGGPIHPPKKVGLAKLGLLRRMTRIKAYDRYDDVVGDLAYHDSNGVSAKAEKGLTF